MPEPTGIESAMRHARYWWNKRLRHARNRPKHRIALPHVPRCAGTSLTEALSAHLPPHQVVRLQTSATTRVAGTNGRSLEAFRQELMWYLARSRDYELITGHVGYSPKMYTDLRPRWSFVTVLRDPVERFLSSFFYRRYKSTPHAALDMPLEQYLDTRRARQSGSIYVRYFAGDGAREPTSERVVRAVDNLSRLQLVGSTDHLGSFSEAFHRRFGLSLRIGERNVSPIDHAGRQVAGTLRRRIEALCAPDREVYEEMRRRIRTY